MRFKGRVEPRHNRGARETLMLGKDTDVRVDKDREEKRAESGKEEKRVPFVKGELLK